MDFHLETPDIPGVRATRKPLKCSKFLDSDARYGVAATGQLLAWLGLLGLDSLARTHKSLIAIASLTSSGPRQQVEELANRTQTFGSTDRTSRGGVATIATVRPNCIGRGRILALGMVQRERLHGVSEIIAAAADCGEAVEDPRAGRQQWQAAIAALEALLLCETRSEWEAIILSGPSPVLTHPELLACVRTGSFGTERDHKQGCLPSAARADAMPPSLGTFPLPPQDPLAQEAFCLVLSERFALAMAIDPVGRFQFSFAPPVARQVWQMLSGRLPPGDRACLLAAIDYRGTYAWPEPSYQTVAQFGQALLAALPVISHEGTGNLVDAELLQALTHEVRTPLTAIRLWTRLLLKRQDLPSPALQHLQGIERECTTQIERMELLFRAAELTVRRTQPPGIILQPIALADVLPHRIPCWQQIAQRRQITLDVQLPQSLPVVLSDATLLDRTLAGLLENYMAGAPAGGRVRLEIAITGDRLKLQLSQPQADCRQLRSTPLKAIGRLLAFHPETGNLTLNLDVTKNLFHALGAKLTIRQHATHGSVLAVFLPLEICRQS